MFKRICRICGHTRKVAWPVSRPTPHYYHKMLYQTLIQTLISTGRVDLSTEIMGVCNLRTLLTVGKMSRIGALEVYVKCALGTCSHTALSEPSCSLLCLSPCSCAICSVIKGFYFLIKFFVFL